MVNHSVAASNNIYDIFQIELHSRINILPIKSTSGNYCISINMQCCSGDFIMATDEFLETNSKVYNLLIKGEEYYIEVLNYDTLINVRKSQHRDKIIDSVAEKAGLSKTDSSKFLTATLESVTEGLKAGDKVPLIGLGTFRVSQRTARTGRNPQTGEALAIAASKTAKFKAGQQLKNAVN